MRKLTPFLLLVVIGLLSSNCMGIRHLSIDTREPGQIAWLPHITSVAVVNNVVQQPDDVFHNYRPINGDWARDTVSSENIAFIYTEAMAQFLEEEGHFDRVIFVREPIRTDSDFFTEHPLTPEAMGRIMRQTGANAVISLDQLLIRTDLEGYFNVVGVRFARLIARIQSVIRVYMPTLEGQIPVIHYTDSLVWRNLDPSGTILYAAKSLPLMRERAMQQLVVLAANRMTNTLSPHWVTKERWYYTSLGARMREGARFAQGNQWDRALERWEVAFRNARGREKAKAANNVALAHEMLDDIETALEWATTAYELFQQSTSPNSLERRRSLLYKNELQRRLQVVNQLLNMTD